MVLRYGETDRRGSLRRIERAEPDRTSDAHQHKRRCSYSGVSSDPAINSSHDRTRECVVGTDVFRTIAENITQVVARCHHCSPRISTLSFSSPLETRDFTVPGAHFNTCATSASDKSS